VSRVGARFACLARPQLAWWVLLEEGCPSRILDTLVAVVREAVTARRLLGFLVRLVAFTGRAVLFEINFLGRVTSVLPGGVVATLALGALEGNGDAMSSCHGYTLGGRRTPAIARRVPRCNCRLQLLQTRRLTPRASGATYAVHSLSAR
jgi:hypothetical protein